MPAGNNISHTSCDWHRRHFEAGFSEDIRGIPVAGERLRDEAAAGVGNPSLRLRLSQGSLERLSAAGRDVRS
ncbi:MAG: hypothetical protein WC778_05495 [Negativicutes bacterium]